MTHRSLHLFGDEEYLGYMNHQNDPENLFERACRRHRYTLTKIPKQSHQTPDYEVTTPHGPFIAEVKSINPNPEDEEKIRELQQTGMTTTIHLRIGVRAKVKIKEALDQLRPHESKKVPLVVVLYDNVRIGSTPLAYPDLHVQPSYIDAAMFGRLRVHVSLNESAPKMPDDRTNEGLVGPKTNNSLSAVIVISGWDDKTLEIYHNPFAAVPLAHGVFTDEKCSHMTKDKADAFGNLGEWKAVGSRMD